MIERQVDEQKNQTSISLPFSSTIISDQYRSLRRFNNLFQPVNYLITLLAIFGSIGFITVLFGDTENLIIMDIYVVSILVVLFSSLFLLILLFFYIQVPSKLVKSLYPQRTMVIFDTYPTTEGYNTIQDVYLRLRYIFLQEEMRTKKKPVKLNKRVFNKSIKHKGKIYQFDIFQRITNSITVILFAFITTLFGLFLLLFYEDIIYYYELTNTFHIIILGFIFLLLFLIYIGFVYCLFYTNNLLIVKSYKDKLTINNINEFNKSVEQLIRGKVEPLIAAMLTDKDVDPTVLEYVQSEEGLIKDQFPITLIQKTADGFKLIWTG